MKLAKSPAKRSSTRRPRGSAKLRSASICLPQSPQIEDHENRSTKGAQAAGAKFQGVAWDKSNHVFPTASHQP